MARRKKPKSNKPKSNSKPLTIFGLHLDYWELVVAIIALAVSIYLPFYFRDDEKKSTTANLNIQVILQPMIEREDLWKGAMLIINQGPAEAKPFVVHLSLAHIMQYTLIAPPAVHCPSIINTGVDYAGGGQTYTVSISNLPPKSSCDIVVVFQASEKLAKETFEMWPMNAYTPEFFGRFFKSITITGENTTQVFNSFALPEPVSTWELP